MLQFRHHARDSGQSPWGRLGQPRGASLLRKPKPLAPRIHPSWCTCQACVPTTGAFDRRVIQLQAAAVAGFVILLYALALFFMPEIVSAFRTAPPDIAIASVR